MHISFIITLYHWEGIQTQVLLTHSFSRSRLQTHVNPLRPIDLSWPFTIWGIDIVVMLTRAPRGYRYLFVAIGTFTKWMEAMPVVNTTQEAAVKFLQSIIFRFSVSRWVLTDNGT
jgi:hypothetical protein